MPSLKSALFEFHISRQARDLYQFDDALFSLSGNVIFANFHAARVFAQKMNARRDLVAFPERAVRAGQVNAMGLIDEILHLVVQRYREQRNAEAIEQALNWLLEKVGAERLENALRAFARQYPPLDVYRGACSLDEYLSGESLREDGVMVSNRHLVLEEMLLLWLANVNPAFSPFQELFDDRDLQKDGAYLEIIQGLQDFFATQPLFGPDHQPLIEMLRAPALAAPYSLSGQLEYIRGRWGYLLGRYLYRLLSSLDLIKEEEKAFFGFGPGPALVYEFAGLEAEPERFSPDRDWMPSLVLIAKNSYVWLDQLSKKYKRSIVRLDQIPDEELDVLARWGLSGLWLIGLWERSPASQIIKQMRGNPDAVASAYSLFGYDVAADLGGDDAYRALRDRAWKRGIRLASDMVPNHMGIDSRWVVEHPDWFISLDYSPFPSYTFNGRNLSWDDRVGIYLEDHYYDSTDAAVVFKRVDFWTGTTKYIYHGNDGTSMPWNDTAQLNYLLPEVREAVIQTILHVARKFPVIRFDAAMTLAKRHYQRLWFPEPGSGGDIPSRAEHGITKADFDRAFPQEFWREVVDRVAQEVPDTLLLAEAFWLMEGYFVRTLGMHRVYNSAFMNMLRDEKNQEYRLVIKNTLEFDPEILKRYVNFMSNPDERTAVEQFGKGDKYFGICILMATMPGLPMFGHGQVEGYTEKYGMEYKKAYWDEHADGYLVERHEREVFPLLRQRYLFAEVENFRLYDFYTPEGFVNEDVFAYSNRSGEQRSLVIYHNRYATAQGWIRESAAFPQKSGQGDERVMVQHNLGEGLGLSEDPGAFVIFRDHITGLEYIRNCRELHQMGLFVELQAYKCHVFLDFRQVQDDEYHAYAHLAAYLDGRGVPSVDEALKEIFLQPVHTAFRELVNVGALRWLIDHRAAASQKERRQESLAQALDEIEQKAGVLLEEIRDLVGGEGDPQAIAAQIRQEVDGLLALPDLKQRFPALKGRRYTSALKYLRQGPDGKGQAEAGEAALWGTLLCWAFVSKLGKVIAAQEYAEQSRTWIDEWLLGKIIAACLIELGLSQDDAWRNVGLIRLLTSQQAWCFKEEQVDLVYRALQNWLKDPDGQTYLMVHRYQGVLWFNKEAFETLMWWLFVAALLGAMHPVESGELEEQAVVLPEAHMLNCYQALQRLLEAKDASDYQVEKLLRVLGEQQGATG